MSVVNEPGLELALFGDHLAIDDLGRRRIVLPFDVIHLIISAVDPRVDLETMRSCALVSRAFHASACPLLFRHLTLSMGLKTPRTLTSFTDFIKDNPVIASYVRELSFNDYDYQQDFDITSWKYTIPIAIDNNLLPNLRSLVFQNIDNFYNYLEYKFFDHVKANLGRITSLELRICCLNHEVLNLWVSSFPQLKSLHVHQYWLDSYGESEEVQIDDSLEELVPLSPDLFPHLVSFKFHSDKDGSGPSTGAFTEWIMGTTDTIEELCLHVHLGSTERVARLVGRAPALRQLELFFQIHDCDDVHDLANLDIVLRYFDLSLNPNLENLHLHIPKSRHTHHFLEQLPSSNNISSLTFTLSFKSEKDFEMQRELLEKVDSVLSDHSKFRSLSHLHLIFSGNLSKDTVLPWFREVFPNVPPATVRSYELENDLPDYVCHPRQQRDP